MSLAPSCSTPSPTNPLSLLHLPWLKASEADTGYSAVTVKSQKSGRVIVTSDDPSLTAEERVWIADYLVTSMNTVSSAWPDWSGRHALELPLVVQSIHTLVPTLRALGGTHPRHSFVRKIVDTIKRGHDVEGDRIIGIKGWFPACQKLCSAATRVAPASFTMSALGPMPWMWTIDNHCIHVTSCHPKTKRPLVIFRSHLVDTFNPDIVRGTSELLHGTIETFRTLGPNDASMPQRVSSALSRLRLVLPYLKTATDVIQSIPRVDNSDVHHYVTTLAACIDRLQSFDALMGPRNNGLAQSFKLMNRPIVTNKVSLKNRARPRASSTQHLIQSPRQLVLL